MTTNKFHEPSHTALFLILLVGILYHTALIKFFKVEKAQVSKEVAYEEEIVNQEIVYEIEYIGDSLPEVEDEIAIAIAIEPALELDKTPVLKTNLWRPDYDTCSVNNLAKEKKISGS
ncbi:MAG TPA: hypothetical protein EYF95_09265, partial [Flavobacteriales bacterium]|nr:hypothetical protein [Flavobacteriales bacterium]